MQLHFQTFGQGRPVVVLHGLFGSSDNWLGIAPRLAEHFQIFLVDLRNHGQSPHAAEMNFPLLAGDVAEFLDQRQLTAADIVGHSLGGKVAMQLALAQPERVRKLVVSDMAPRVYPPAHEKILTALLALDLSSFQTRHQIETALETAIPNLIIRRFLLKNLGRDAIGNLVWKINLLGLADNYARLGEAVTGPAACARPALFIRGGKSNFIRTTDEPEIRRWFPQVEIQTIAAAGHWVHADQPEDFTRRVLDFLQTD